MAAGGNQFMMETTTEQTALLFSAVSGSARQLFQLLRCINFVSKVHVQITKDGLRFTAEESQVMQGLEVVLPLNLVLLTTAFRLHLPGKVIIHSLHVYTRS